MTIVTLLLPPLVSLCLGVADRDPLPVRVVDEHLPRDIAMHAGACLNRP